MKYYLDEDIRPKIAALLKKRGIDAISAHDAGKVQLSDREQLDHASAQGRCMVTRNRDDFIRLTVQFFNEHRPHFGLLTIPYSIPGDQFTAIATAISKHASSCPKGTEPYRIDFLKS